MIPTAQKRKWGQVAFNKLLTRVLGRAGGPRGRSGSGHCADGGGRTIDLASASEGMGLRTALTFLTSLLVCRARGQVRHANFRRPH